MSNLLNICGIIIASSQYPDATLQQFYRQYYHCEIQAEQNKKKFRVQMIFLCFPISRYMVACFYN